MYEFHTTQEGTGVHPGETFDLDYSVMGSVRRTPGLNLQIGVAGYEARQTTAKTGPNITSEVSAERYAINSFGLAMIIAFPKRKASVGFRTRESADRATYRGTGEFSGDVSFWKSRRKEIPLAETVLELDDIQSGVLRPRPSPYAATYVIFRIDDRNAGREMMLRLRSVVSSAAQAERSDPDTWVSASLTYQGLKSLGVPQESLDSFSPEFRQGMAARAALLGDHGDSSPEHWEKLLGSKMYVAITAIAPGTQATGAAFEARKAYRGLKAVTLIWRQDCHVLPDEKEAFGFRDGISHPAIEGSGIPGTNPDERPLKPGEFVLGYPDEMSRAPAGAATRATLGRNGTYIVFRKLHQRVAEFRQYLKAQAADADEEELIAAKMMGRWRSGAPLALCPKHDDPALGADARRNNAFLFKQDDAIGYKTPCGSHIRRMNPRDAIVAGVVRIHRLIRRGTSYGPPLPEGVLEDDGVERGLMFAFVGAHLSRQFEFVQSEWMNDNAFFGGSTGKDPVSGAADGTGTFDIPKRPLRQRLQGLPRFVVTRGGEYGFMPGLRAMDWLGNLKT